MTNTATGVALMVLGALWVVVALAGPPIANRAKNAIAAAVVRELRDTSQETPVDHGLTTKPRR